MKIRDGTVVRGPCHPLSLHFEVWEQCNSTLSSSILNATVQTNAPYQCVMDSNASLDITQSSLVITKFQYQFKSIEEVQLKKVTFLYIFKIIYTLFWRTPSDPSVTQCKRFLSYLKITELACVLNF